MILGAIYIYSTMLFLLPAQRIDPSGSDRACGCEEMVFSNVKHIVEVDDYVGVEIVLCHCKNRVSIQGTWKEYEGGHTPAIVHLRGEIKRGRLHLAGESGEGVATLRGTLTATSLVANLSWRIGKHINTRQLNLPKTRSPIHPPP